MVLVVAVVKAADVVMVGKEPDHQAWAVENHQIGL